MTRRRTNMYQLGCYDAMDGSTLVLLEFGAQSVTPPLSTATPGVLLTTTDTRLTYAQLETALIGDSQTTATSPASACCANGLHGHHRARHEQRRRVQRRERLSRDAAGHRLGELRRYRSRGCAGRADRRRRERHRVDRLQRHRSAGGAVGAGLPRRRQHRRRGRQPDLQRLGRRLPVQPRRHPPDLRQRLDPGRLLPADPRAWRVPASRRCRRSTTARSRCSGPTSTRPAAAAIRFAGSLTEHGDCPTGTAPGCNGLTSATPTQGWRALYKARGDSGGPPEHSRGDRPASGPVIWPAHRPSRKLVIDPPKTAGRRVRARDRTPPERRSGPRRLAGTSRVRPRVAPCALRRGVSRFGQAAASLIRNERR